MEEGRGNAATWSDRTGLRGRNMGRREAEGRWTRQLPPARPALSVRAATASQHSLPTRQPKSKLSHMSTTDTWKHMAVPSAYASLCARHIHTLKLNAQY